MAYDKVNWISGETALSADNLGQMDEGISVLHRILLLEPGDSINVASTPCPGYISSDRQQFLFLIPTSRFINASKVNCTKLDLVVRHADGGYPYMRYGSNGGSYKRLGADAVTVWNDSKQAYSNSIASLTCTKRESGIHVNIKFNYQIAKGSNNATAVTNNVPISITAAGTFSFAK